MNRLLLLCAALFAAAACAVPERLEPAHVQIQNVTYEPSNQAFLNPERGFHGNVSLVDETDLSRVRGEGHSLVRAYVRLNCATSYYKA